MVKIELKVVENLGNKEQAIDTLLLDELHGDFIVDDSNAHLGERARIERVVFLEVVNDGLSSWKRSRNGWRKYRDGNREE